MGEVNGWRKKARRTAATAAAAGGASVLAAFGGAYSIPVSAAPYAFAADAATEGSNDTGMQTGEEQSVVIDGSTVSALERESFSSLITPESVDETAQVTPYQIAEDLSNVAGTDKFYILDPSMLAWNGFLVFGNSRTNEFYEFYEENRYAYRRNFITSDSMMHTYHLYFSYLQRNVEENHLRGMLLDLSRQMLAKSSQQYEALKGTAWESAARRNVAYFAVGTSLLDAGTEIPADAADVTAKELALIADASGIAVSPLMDGGDSSYTEDYSQYKPRGYYDVNDDLRSYFRAMMWYGRMAFLQKDGDLSRSALLMTLALDQDTAPLWQQIYSITSFFAGEADDLSYYEYKPIADAVYGENPSAEALTGDEALWDKFLSAAEAMPGPRISSMAGTDDLTEEKGYRFLGQRYSYDEEIFTKLAGEAAGPDASGNLRGLPDALDVPAAMGSDPALQIVTARGAGEFANYSANVQTLRDAAAARSEAEWKSSLSSQWMYTLQPLFSPVPEGYPSFMRSDAWSRKELVTYLGSYTELKHDTVLYGKEFMVEAGGEITPADDRGYVEPVPALYARLKDLSDATSAGLSEYGILSDNQAQDLSILSSLCDQLVTISEKELHNELPSDDEFELIRSVGAQLEHFWQQAHQEDADAAGGRMTTDLYPAALVTDVASNSSGTCLELGIGGVKEMVVVVPLDGQLVIASGPVYSFYQFAQPSSDRLTDAQWCQMLGIQPGEIQYSPENAPQMENWVYDFTINW